MTDVVNQQPVPDAANAANLPPGSSGPVTIRNMTASDGPFAGRMLVEAFRSKYEWAGGKRNFDACARAEGISYGSLTEEMMSRVFIAECEGRPAGMVALKFHGNKDFRGSDHSYEEISCCGRMGLHYMYWMNGLVMEAVSADTCYIDNICVDSQFRGKGIGKLLMERADYEGRKRQCTTMMLWVARDNRAVNLYQRQGYAIVNNTDGCCISWCAVGIRKWYKMEKPL